MTDDEPLDVVEALLNNTILEILLIKDTLPLEISDYILNCLHNAEASYTQRKIIKEEIIK